MIYDRIIKLLKEPLFIFLLLGGALFALFQQASSNYQPDNAEIIVSEAQIRSLLFGFEKVWQRPPSQEEFEGLIQNFIREEVLYREALAMGLDKDDGVVRRRLSQKMEFLSEDIARLEQPTEQELQTYLAVHQDNYRQAALFSFRQIFFDTSKRGQAAQSGAIALLEKLQVQDSDAVTLGDPLMIKHEFKNETETEIKRVLGSQFLELLNGVSVGSWQGPIKSAYGLHLVHIDERTESKAAELNGVREQVVRDWGIQKRKRSNEALYESFRKHYSVTVEDYSSINMTSPRATILSSNSASK